VATTTTTVATTGIGQPPGASISLSGETIASGMACL
jgi:hypothetical protein